MKSTHHHHQRGTKKLLSMKNMTAFGKNNLRGSVRVTCLKIRFTYVRISALWKTHPKVLRL